MEDQETSKSWERQSATALYSFGEMNNEMSQDISKLAEALSLAQGQMTHAMKDASNPMFNSKYADLASVWEAIRKPLSDNGLAVIQTNEAHDGDSVTVITRLVHKSGQWIRGVSSCKIENGSPQVFGSCFSYLRRYALAAMVGVSQADDDANASSKPQPKQPEFLTETQQKELTSYLTIAGVDKDEFLKAAKIKSLDKIPQAKFEGAKAFIKDLKKKAGGS